MIEYDKIDDLLVSSELAKQLVPNKFKFTSQQGRVRRQKLLMASKTLSLTKPIKDITLADICQEAGIPRASAYHFFPNVDSVFLALRFLHAIELLEELKTVDITKYNRWQGYVTALITKGVELMSADTTKSKLIYEANTPDFDEKDGSKRVEYQVVKIFYGNLNEQYDVFDNGRIEDAGMIAYGVVNAIFTLSYRQHGMITEYFQEEAITACIAYLRCYLPEKLTKKPIEPSPIMTD